MNRHSRHYPLLLFILGMTLFTPACAEIHVAAIPPPPLSAKLRVYVQPLSSQNVRNDRPSGRRRSWAVSEDEFKDKQLELVKDYLEDLGYYEVVNADEVRSALGDEVEQSLTRRQMEGNDWALAKRIGKALHADYVMVMEREKTSGSLGQTAFLFTNNLINVESGNTYHASFRLERNTGASFKDRRRGIRATYREIFRKAKDDMLATAMRKGALLSGMSPDESRPGPAGTAQAEPRAESQQPAASERTDEAVIEEGLAQPASAGGSPRLVVYDFDAPPQYKPASLIITEAVREELYRLKRFVLVNRENLEQILKEMALQQTGLIDEKDAVKTGKGLAANQVVTGQMGLLGKTFVLQAKRTDVESLATLGLTSARFELGREDAFFQQLPAFTQQLSGP